MNIEQLFQAPSRIPPSPELPPAPICASCGINPPRVSCIECGAHACHLCAVTVPISYHQMTWQMLADSIDKNYKWIKFYCPECHSKRRGWKH